MDNNYCIFIINYWWYRQSDSIPAKTWPETYIISPSKHWKSPPRELNIVIRGSPFNTQGGGGVEYF